MVLDEVEDQSNNLGVSLSRLRLFLAPHAQHKEEEAPDQAQHRINSKDSDIVTTDQEDLACLESTIPAAAVASVSPLNPTTKEFSRVKYLLQCSLPNYKVHDDMMIWDMKNPSLVAQYEQHASGLLELDSWVGVNDLGASMSDMHSYGFTSLSSGKGMKFTTGNILMENPGKKGRKQYVLCKIAVGRSLVIDSEEQANKRLPQGYNSFYINQTAKDPMTHGYYHEYIINDTLHILPQYLVRFSYQAIDHKTIPNCALCEKNTAAVVCKACEAEICSKCDSEVHSANKLVSRHKRFPIKGTGAVGGRENGENNDYSHIDLTNINMHANCRFHEGKTVEYYCPVCSVPVCVHCKMVGDHSCGDKGSHRLISIADAYEMSVRESIKQDPLIESRKSVITSKLKMITEREGEIKKNKDDIEQAIRQACEIAIQRLEEESNNKMVVLRGEALEMKRQLEHIEWAERYLDSQRHLLHAVDFLNTWNQHKILRAEQRDFPVVHMPSVDSVKADIQVMGRLQVVTGDNMSAFFSEEGSLSNGGAVVHRNGDNDIRKKLMSFKAPPSCDTSMGVGVPNLISPKGKKVIEEIKNDLARSHGGSTLYSAAAPAPRAHGASSTLNPYHLSSGTTGGVGRPEGLHYHGAVVPTAAMPVDYSATLRGFSVHQSRKNVSHRRQPSTDAWSSVLRREMGISEGEEQEQNNV